MELYFDGTLTDKTYELFSFKKKDIETVRTGEVEYEYSLLVIFIAVMIISKLITDMKKFL